MKTISIRQLHDETGRWVRKAAAVGGMQVTERGAVVAQIVPAPAASAEPYFARRKLLPAFHATQSAGRTDSTAGISVERDER